MAIEITAMFKTNLLLVPQQ